MFFFILISKSVDKFDNIYYNYITSKNSQIRIGDGNMYRFKFPNDINKLIDGRTILYLSQLLGVNREHLSLVLKGKRLCDFEYALKLVYKCTNTGDVDLFFNKLEESEVEEWKKN